MWKETIEVPAYKARLTVEFDKPEEEIDPFARRQLGKRNMTTMMACALCQESGPVALSIEQAKKESSSALVVVQALAKAVPPPRFDIGPMRWRRIGRKRTWSSRIKKALSRPVRASD
jgi:hypothetical protein